MVRKTLLGLIACTLLASVAVAEDGPVGGSVSVGVVSSYMWNGIDRVSSFGLDQGPSVQPGVSVGLRNTGLAVNVGGSFVVNDNSELQETTYGVSFNRSVSPVVSVGAGYTYYDNRVSDLTVDPNNHEVWGSVELSSAVGVKPGVAVKYEKSSVEGVDGYAVVVGGVKYDMPLSGLNLGTASVGLGWNADVVYNSAVKTNGVEVVPSGVSAVQLGLKAPVTAGGVVVTPSVNYQVTVSDEVKAINGGVDGPQDGTFWATIGVAYGF